MLLVFIKGKSLPKINVAGLFAAYPIRLVLIDTNVYLISFTNFGKDFREGNLTAERRLHDHFNSLLGSGLLGSGLLGSGLFRHGSFGLGNLLGSGLCACFSGSLICILLFTD